MKTEQKSIPVGVRQFGTERPLQSKPSILAEKYPRMKEIDDRLNTILNTLYLYGVDCIHETEADF